MNRAQEMPREIFRVFPRILCSLSSPALPGTGASALFAVRFLSLRVRYYSSNDRILDYY